MMDLTLRQKIGQMLMAGFPGPAIGPTYERLIREYKLGNVILFSENLKNASQTRELCASLQEQILQNTGFPALIAVDQEGGMVSRMPPDGTNIPSAMAVAATGDPHNAFLAGELTARELRAMGINMDIAPVLDINSNPENPLIGVRSYGDTAETVAAYGNAMAKGLLSGQVIPVAKHFPGHGDTAVDSHLGLPVVEKTQKELEQCELLPFRSAIVHGIPCIMAAHILYPKIEKDQVPASLSHDILTGLLKESCGFDGLVITDCLEMQAVQAGFGTAAGAVAAVCAGAHLVCISHTAALVEQAAKALEVAVQSGSLPMAVVDEAVEKILALKRRFALGAYGTLSEVGCARHRALAAGMSAQSITLVRGALPAQTGKTLFIGCRAVRSTPVVDETGSALCFPFYLADRLGGTGIEMSVEPDEPERARIAAQARQYDTVVIGTYDGLRHPGQIELANLLGRQQNVVVAALHSPYDLREIGPCAAAFALFEYTFPAFDAFAHILAGEAAAEGRLGIRLKKGADAGAGGED